MDNSRDLPGYKYYLDASTGERPAVYVTFVDLAPDPACAVNGVVFPVEEEALAALDERERNYERREVTGRLSAAPSGSRLWAYFGRPAARERFERGRSTGTAVVSRAYRDGVRNGFAQLGDGELCQFAASTDVPGVPVLDLTRVELAPADR
jgi:gamma-glutamylcyclotransferase (GGCT)/AIG2-like uncharacterized protein YtfP